MSIYNLSKEVPALKICIGDFLLCGGPFLATHTMQDFHQFSTLASCPVKPSSNLFQNFVYSKVAAGRSIMSLLQYPFNTFPWNDNLQDTGFQIWCLPFSYEALHSVQLTHPNGPINFERYLLSNNLLPTRSTITLLSL